MSPLRPLLRRWALSSTAAARQVPEAPPAARASDGGPDPDRVLVLGSGPAGAWTDDGSAPLPAALSAALAARTGRGAIVEARGTPHAMIDEVASTLRTATLGRYDAVVLIVGMADAAAGSGAAGWRRALTEMVSIAREETPRGAAVVLTRIPPASSTGVYRGSRVMLADLRVRAFNRQIVRVARATPGVTVSAIPVPGAGVRVATTEWYRLCGERLAADLAPLLGEDR